MNRGLLLPAEIRAALNGVRQRLRRYIFWHGLGVLIALAGLLFWGSFLFDYAYFSLWKMEPPVWFRALLLVASLACLAVLAARQLGLPLLRPLRDTGLAMVLEKRFPQLKEGLITAVEARQNPDIAKSAATQIMLQKSLNVVTNTVSHIDLDDVFDQVPLRRIVFAAGAFMAGILGLSVVSPAAVERWASGYLSLQESYWPRTNQLVLRVLAQPGDRLCDFRDGVYLHPKGQNLHLVISSEGGIPLPQQARLIYRTADHQTGRAYLARIGDQPFKHVLNGLLENTSIWISGGDFAHSVPYEVRVVAAPVIEQIETQCRYPEYTSLNESSDPNSYRRLIVPGSELSLPQETRLLLTGRTNKPIRNLHCEFEWPGKRIDVDYELSQDESTGRRNVVSAVISARPLSGEGGWKGAAPASWLPGAITDNARQFTIPLWLTTGTSLPQDRPYLTTAEEGVLPLEAPLALPEKTTVKITLHDEDGVVSLEPNRLVILGRPDLPPEVQTSLKGIGSSVTRQARVPLIGKVKDDYGISKAEFEYRVGDGSDWKSKELSAPPDGNPKEFVTTRGAGEAFERFDLITLDLPLKQKLSLRLMAADNDNLHGPHYGRGTIHQFLVVSNEELLSLLYSREINLRRRFEQVIVEIQRSRDDLATIPERVLAKSETASQSGIGVSLSRGLQDLRKNSGETLGIEQAFRELREELINNGVDTPNMLDRIDRRILEPLGRAREFRFPAVDRQLGSLRLDWERNRLAPAEIGETVANLDLLLSEFQQILNEMRKLETFQEALELLKGIIEGQDDLLERTKKERKEKALKALE